MFANDVPRAVGGGLGDEIVAVAGSALDGYEDVTIGDRTRIDANARTVARRNQFLEFIKIHRVTQTYFLSILAKSPQSSTVGTRRRRIICSRVGIILVRHCLFGL